MQTTKLKKFATEARNKLRQGVANRLVILGFDEAGVPMVSPELVPGGAVWGEKPCTVAFHRGFKALEEQIRQYGVNHVVEEAAYTWFNRLMAIRILTMNGLCEPVLRYVGSTRTPLIVDEARQGHLPEMVDEDRKALMQLLDDDTKTAEQFAMLISVFCHNTPLIANCFSQGGGAPSHRNSDYTDILFPANILNPEGFLDSLNTTDFITEEDYHSSELLGWLYQFYISEKKDQVFAKKGKYDADDIPAATQIFTPNWIVKYMVQNSILPQLMPEDRIVREKYRYFVPSPSDTKHQTPNTKYRDLEEMRVADLACGSGHILNECFDLLYDLYISEGYTRREAIEFIFTQNLTGIDIDTRAKQLATFALMLKACQRDASLVDASLMPRVYSWEEARPRAVKQMMDFIRDNHAETMTKSVMDELEDSFALLENARELGSILKFNLSDDAKCLLEEYAKSDNSARGRASSQLILALSIHYDAIVMNPPYMPTNKIESLSAYVNKHYKEGKADMFAVFMMVCMDRLKNGGRMGMINMQSWMFLSSFESLRELFLKEYTLSSMLHLGPRTFDELSGEVVQNTAFVFEKREPTEETTGVFYRLVDGKNCSDKETMFLGGNTRYEVEQGIFEKIPGMLLGYWVSNEFINNFSHNNVGSVLVTREGMATADNDRFLRLWPEVSKFRFSKIDSASDKWYPYNKGGSFRKWYGNRDYVVDWANNGFEIRNNIDSKTGRIRSHNYNGEYAFRESITWSAIASGNISLRYCEEGFLWDSKGASGFSQGKLIYSLGLINSKVSKRYLDLLSPTLDFKVGDIIQIPYLEDISTEPIVLDCVSISKQDWDAHETSWDFERNPLLAVDTETYLDNINAMIERHLQETCEILCIDSAAPQFDSLEWRYEQYKQKWESLFMKLHANEEELNRRFIDIYGLQDELTPDVPLNEVTILQQGEVSWEEARPRAINSDDFLRKEDEIAIHGDHLPHWNQSDTYVFFTFRLGDSLPKEKQEEIKSKRDIWMKALSLPWDEETEREYQRTFTHKVEEWLDNGYGSCILKDPKASSIVLATILHDDGKKYDLIDYVIMPNHVHALVRMVGDTKVEYLMQEWKSVSSHKLRKQFGSEWCGWMEKYHDRHIRNEEHFNNVIGYIYKNYSHGGVKIGGSVYMDGETLAVRGRTSSQLVWHPEVVMKQFISYAVGCMMGRYRLDRPGLAIAHPNETPEEVAEYPIPGTDEKFWIDDDGIIPLMPEDCGFHDNAVNRFATFVRQTLGDQTQIENLNFIEECIGKSLEQYFIKDFWKDHKKMYQNRPIYWLFASKKGAFQVLVYVHRMNVATVERIRSRYLLPYIERLNKRIEDLQANESTLSTKQRNQLKTLRTQVEECSEYHNRLAVVAERGIVPNLDDGIIKNHALFGDIVTKLK